MDSRVLESFANDAASLAGRSLSVPNPDYGTVYGFSWLDLMDALIEVGVPILRDCFDDDPVEARLRARRALNPESVRRPRRPWLLRVLPFVSETADGDYNQAVRDRRLVTSRLRQSLRAKGDGKPSEELVEAMADAMFQRLIDGDNAEYRAMREEALQ